MWGQAFPPKPPQVVVSPASVVFAWSVPRAESVARTLERVAETDSCPGELRQVLRDAWGDLQRGIDHARTVVPITRREGFVPTREVANPFVRSIHRGAE